MHCFQNNQKNFNEGFKIVEKQFNKSIIHGVALKDFFSNTLINDNDIDILRLIMKKILKQHYPDINFMGDKLF